MTISQGDMDRRIGREVQARNQNPSTGFGAFGLAIARVININYEELWVTLKVQTGEEDTFDRLPVPLTFPGAGARSFMGVMPEIGDQCIVGWMTQNSSGGTKTPVILSWLVPGWWVGHDWITTQDYSQEELDHDPANRVRHEGRFERIRHKLRHMEPGNALVTSSQGSDLILNESIHLTNRRGNEIILRDQDQAIVFRSLQEFHATGGTRTYSGMVQRDASLLPTQMFSDGNLWDSGYLTDSDGNVIHENKLEETGDDGSLSPAPVFKRTVASGIPDSQLMFDEYVDPYSFLRRGLFIDENGRIVDPTLTRSDAVYGGKPFYRVSVDLDQSEDRHLNSAIGHVDGGEAFTEMRVELNHTWDGRLPVTEQTDGFDADRLPGGLPDSVNRFGRTNSPFLEFVLGTVVGNDPYSPEGRSQYGVPLKPVIFNDNGAPQPRIESALGDPIGRQAATLTRIRPPTGNPGSPTFWSTTKDGRAFFSIGGLKSEPHSLQGNLLSGLRIQSGGSFDLVASQGFSLRSAKGDNEFNLGADIFSESGAVRIYAGGRTQIGRSVAEFPRTGSGEGDQPSLMLEGVGPVVIKSGKSIKFSAPQLDLGNSQRLSLKALSTMDIGAGDKIRMNTTTLDQTTTGKCTETFSGPLNGLPTNGPFRQQIFAPGIGFVGGPNDTYLNVLGDRTENFLLGNHTTSIAVGNLTYQTGLGVWTARAGANQILVDSVTGMNAVMANGVVNLTATSGAVTISGSVSVQVRSAGPVTVSSGTNVVLAAPGKTGPIICGSDLDPLTGLPLAFLGMGSPGHNLAGAPI